MSAPTQRSLRTAASRRVLIAVAVVAAAAIAYKVTAAIAVGPGWDTYAFLANAAEFAGRGFGYTELHRAPGLSALVAGGFVAGLPLSVWVIQVADGLLTLAGVVAFYLVARRRFRPLLAGVGALMLLCVQPLWLYLGSGYTDMPSVALSLWLLWACIKATEEDARWYLLVGPLFIAATMTRFTALLAAFPVAVWLVLRWRPFHQAKHLLGAGALAVVTYLPAARFYAERFGDVMFPFILAFRMSENVATPGGEAAAQASGTWYVRHLPAFLAGEPLAIVGMLVLIAAAAGIALGLWSYVRESAPRPSRLALAALAVAPALLAQAGAGVLLRQVTIPLAVAGVWYALAPHEEDPRGRRTTAESALLAVMTAWLLAYFDFHGHQTIQVARYIVPMAPALVFLVLYGCQTFVTDVRDTLIGERSASDESALRPLLRFAAPAGLGLFVALVLGHTVATTSWEPDRYVVAARETAAWLVEQRSLEGAVVYSDLWPLTAWYARIPARPMPTYTRAEAFGHALDRDGVDYYVTIRGRRFPAYDTVLQAGPATVLERTAPPAQGLARVLYLGKAWDNYLESVTDYAFYLDGTAGRYGWEGTAFFDSVSADDLARYEAVAVYGIRWRDRASGEAALGKYLAAGGSVVIDASANLATLPYDLADTVVFDTVIRREVVARDAAIEVMPAFAGRHPEVGVVRASPFLDEGGEPWYGAAYSPLPGAEELEVLATVGGRPAIVVRRVGSGRVYWIGCNLVWHAFLTENDAEMALVSAVFAEAIETSSAGGTR